MDEAENGEDEMNEEEGEEEMEEDAGAGDDKTNGMSGLTR